METSIIYGKKVAKQVSFHMFLSKYIEVLIKFGN